MSALDLDALERRARKGIVFSPDETRALITRLRAAEARTAWQPIETAPVGVWVLTWSVRGVYGAAAPNAAAPCALVARRDAWGWGEFDGGAVEPTHWQPLPAAPEAPHG